MTDYTAQIKSKGLDATGVTEDVVRGLYSKLGSHVMLICEARIDARSDGTDGSHKVQLSLTQVEPATDSNLDDHLRELTRTLHYNRQLDAGQPTLDANENEPNVTDVLAAGARFRPHPYLTSQLALDQAGDNGPVCDVCGLLEDAAVHSADPAPSDEADTDADDLEDADNDELPTDEPDDEDQTDDDSASTNVVAFSNR